MNRILERHNQNGSSGHDTTMGKYESGDYVKVEFSSEETGESERMWVCVQNSDDDAKIVYGQLDNEPMVNTDLRLGQELAIKYDLVQEHRKSADFDRPVN